MCVDVCVCVCVCLCLCVFSIVVIGGRGHDGVCTMSVHDCTTCSLSAEIHDCGSGSTSTVLLNESTCQALRSPKAGFTEAFLRCDSREACKSPNRSHPTPHATAASGPSQKLSLLNLCDATSDLAYDFDLFYSKFVQMFKSCLLIFTSFTKGE